MSHDVTTFALMQRFDCKTANLLQAIIDHMNFPDTEIHDSTSPDKIWYYILHMSINVNKTLRLIASVTIQYRIKCNLV